MFMLCFRKRGASNVYTYARYIMICCPALYFLFDLYSFLHKQHVVNKTLAQKRFFLTLCIVFCRLILLSKNDSGGQNPENVLKHDNEKKG